MNRVDSGAETLENESVGVSFTVNGSRADGLEQYV